MVKIIYKKEIEGITHDELNSADLILKEYGEKIERKLGDEVEIEIYVKNYGKIKTNEYEVTLRVLCSGNNGCNRHFFASKTTERDFLKAVHAALNKLDAEIEHKLHVSDQGKR